jgi:hypothetical protein
LPATIGVLIPLSKLAPVHANWANGTEARCDPGAMPGETWQSGGGGHLR